MGILMTAACREDMTGGGFPAWKAARAWSMNMAVTTIFMLFAYACPAMAQDETADTTVAGITTGDTAVISDTDSIDTGSICYDMSELDDVNEGGSLHKILKEKFIEGNAGFMSLVALALIIGLALCIERIIYLTLSEINDRKLLEGVEQKVSADDIEGAKQLCRDTRGPIASICYQGLCRIHSSMEEIERSVASYGSVQVANLEKGCSWITLFIIIAPSLGFLGTVIGMVMAFEQIQLAGDISPTIVAAGMKVALITTIFGIIVAVILQIFYNFILAKIERLTQRMEEDAIVLFDIITKYKQDK